MLPPSTSLPVMGEIAGVNTASLGVYLHSSKTGAKRVEGFHNELNSHVIDLKRDGLCQVVPGLLSLTEHVQCFEHQVGCSQRDSAL